MNLTHSWRRYRKGVLALFLYGATMSMASAMDFMPVADVKPGMTGHADTVVSGDTISSFDVKVLGVMKDRGPSGDLILVKVSGPVIDASGGIVHGMSGSPVYIDNKLVGAVAYGWGFADGTIGMLTPIEQMTALWNVPYQKNLPNPWKDTQLIPLGTPLMADGFDDASLSYLENKFKNYGYKAYNTASAAGDDVKKPLVAGGSVAALLVKGDLKMGAIGTVTYVDKDRIVAFGHPFLKRGSVGYFMNNSNIFTVVKSVESGFKLGSMGQEVGSITEDRGSGIAGIEGKWAAGIPVALHLRDLDTGKERQGGVTVIDAHDMTPTLVASSIYSLLNKTMDRSGEGTSKVTLKIQPRDPKIKPLERTNYFYSSQSIAAKSIDETYDILESLMNNTFKDYDIQNIDVSIDVEAARKTARIVDANADTLIVSPGDDIVVTANLQTYRDGMIHKEIMYKVPKDQKLGNYTLEVRGGGVVPLPYLFEKQKYNLTDEIIRRLRVYKDFDEYYKQLLEQDRNNQIVVEILDDGVSMVDDGKEKPSKVRIDTSDATPVPSDVKPVKPTDAVDVEEKNPKAAVDTDYVILGDGQFNLQVMSPKDRDKARAKKAKALAAKIQSMTDEELLKQSQAAAN